MKKSSLIFSLGCMPLLVASARFGYGIFFAAELWLLFFAVILAEKVVKLVSVTKSAKLFVMFFSAATAAVFSLVSSLLFPIAELTLRFYILYTSISYILFLSVAEYDEHYQSFSLIGFYTVFMICFSLLREFIGLGSISFLVPTGLVTLHIIPDKFLVFKQLGTNGGAFILLGIILWIYYSIVRKGGLISLAEE